MSAIMQGIKAGTAGHFLGRPLEVGLQRFTDDFHSTQPSHLLQYAIVRDMAQDKKNTHFQFYSYDNFTRLVASGRATWSPTGATAGPDEHAKVQNESAPTAPLPIPIVDQFGFPYLRAGDFLSEEGTESLPDIVRSAGRQQYAFSCSDLVVAERPDNEIGQSSSHLRYCRNPTNRYFCSLRNGL